MSHVSPEMRECIEECTSCHNVCLETVTHCLQMGGAHSEAAHVRLMLDCIEICQTSADFMLRGSDFHIRTCAVCAEICDQCATDCDRFPEDFMKRCAASCRRCAESCRLMTGEMPMIMAA